MGNMLNPKWVFLLECLRETVSMHKFTYGLTQIKLAKTKEKTTIRYSILGTGKESEDVSLLTIFDDNEMLFKFRPKDIKIISSTATILNLKTEIKYAMVWRQLKTDTDDITISFQDLKTLKKFRTTLNDVASNDLILNAIKGQDAFTLGMEFEKMRRNRDSRK